VVRSLRGALSALAVTALVCAGLAVAGAPAHATVADTDEGGQTTRSMIVERALTWTTEKVPYSETSYWPAGAPSAGVGHSYRQDCSGFLSMAWDLTGSAVTGDFVSTTSAYDTQLASTALLQPGDMLGTSGHVVLFLGWSADDAGRHRYFDMVSEATTGTDASVSTDQDLLGYWKSYAPYVDKHVLADAPSAVSWGPGRTDQVELTAAGHVVHRYQAAAGGAWGSEDVTAKHDLPLLRTTPVIASRGASSLDILGTTASGGLIDVAWSPSTSWVLHTITTSGTVFGLSVAGESGRVDVFGRQPGDDGMGVLLHGALTGTSTWSGWVSVIGAPALADDPAIARTSSTTVDVVVENSTGTLTFGVWGPSARYTWSLPFGSTRVPTRPSVTWMCDGTTVVTATVGTALQQATLAPGATSWTPFAAVPAMPAIAGAPAWASAAAIPSSTSGAPLDVYTATSAGTIAEAQRSAAGVWSYLGSA
jgi:hypothetical protein